MSFIYVNISEVRDANYDLPYVEDKAGYVRRCTQNIRKEIPSCIADKYGIGQRLDSVCKEIENLEMRIGRLYEATNACMEQYAYAEYKNDNNAKAFI